MVVSTQESDPAKRHGAFAWSCTVAISAAALGARLDFEIVVLAASAFLGAAAVFWVVKKLARRLAGALPIAATPGVATLQACAYLGVLALWLWTAAFFVPAFVLVYPEPALNRAYAESLGVELGPLLFAALGVCIAVTLSAVLAIRALNSPVPAASGILRALCLGAPVACFILALAPFAYFPDWESAWKSFGADLPAPTRLLLATEAYWGILPALSLSLFGLAWVRRSNAFVFTRSVTAQLLLLMLCSALLTFAVVAAWLPNFGLCGAV
jgi:hypothetical protein